MDKAAKKQKITYRCSHTGKEVDGNPSRLPRGWKRIGEEHICPEAWKARYVVRAVTLPVMCPVVPDGTGPQSREWKAAWNEFREAVNDAWSKSTNTTAWAYKQLLQNDVVRQASDKKCPKMPKIYLYGMGDWSGWAQSAAAVLRKAEQAYQAKRYEIVWLGKSRLPDTRYPQPYPVPPQAMALSIDDNDRPKVEFRLPAGRAAVWLQGGARYRRQREQIKWLIENPQLIGEAAIYKRDKDVMVKLVGWFPRKEANGTKGTLHIRTDPESLIVAINDADEKLFVIHGDRAKDWTTRHNIWIQRQRNDQKMERRTPKRKARKEREDVQARTKKFRQRMDTFIDQTAAQIVNYASRRRVATIVYNDSCREYLKDFPWFQLETGIKQRCDAAGIAFERRENE